MSIYNQVGTGGFKNRIRDTQSEYIKRNFDSSEAYGLYDVTRDNVTFTEPFPIQIFTLKSTGERKFYAHPDFSIVKGDIIDYTEDGHPYLVAEEDIHSGVNSFGKILRMEQTISWKDSEGIVHSVPYFMPNTGVGSQDSNYQVPLSDTKKQVWLQFNDETKTIFENQRFILGNLSPFKVTARDNFSNTGIFKITMESTQKLSEDDFVTGVAYNDTPINTVPQTGKNGIYFDADSLGIQVGLSKTMDVYEYLNDIIVPATVFTFRIDGIDSGEYNIVTTTDNSIEIECLGYYYSGTLVAIDTSTLLEYSIPLTLESMF